MPLTAFQALRRKDGSPMNAISIRLATIATALAGVAALAGLLVPGLYVDAPNWVQQARGTDLTTLFLAVPVLASGLLVSRTWLRGGPAWRWWPADPHPGRDGGRDPTFVTRSIRQCGATTGRPTRSALTCHSRAVVAASYEESCDFFALRLAKY